MSTVARSGSDLLSAFLNADTYEAAAEALRTTAVPLDGNFVEQLNYTAEQAERRGDHDAAHVRRAFNYVQEFRYRTSADHLASAVAVEFVRAIAAQPSPDALNAFVAANLERFDADVVTALFGSAYFVQPADESKLRVLMQLGRMASDRLQLKLRHTPPRQYRYFLQQLRAAYRERKMADMLWENSEFVDRPLMYTLTHGLDAASAADDIHFVESLALHVERDLAAYLYERLAEVFAAQREPNKQVQALVMAGKHRDALRVEGVSTPVRLWLFGTVAEYLMSAPGDSVANVEEAITWLDQAEQLASAPDISVSQRAVLRNLQGDAYRYRLAGNRVQNFEVAARCYQEAADICPPEFDPVPHAYALANLGQLVGLSDKLEDVESGIALIDQALALSDDHGAALVDKSNLHLRAHDLGASGQLDLAMQAARSATEQPSVQQETAMQAAALIAYGGAVVRSQSPPPDGDMVLDMAVQIADAAVGRREYAAMAKFHLGQWHVAHDALPEARDMFLAAVADLETDAQTDEFRLQIERQSGPVYGRLMEVLLRLGQPKEALDYLERSKARSLGDMIAARETLPADTVPHELVEEYVRLRERKRYLESRSRMMRFGRGPQWQALADTQRQLPQIDHVIRVADVEVMANAKLLEGVEAALTHIVSAIRQFQPDFTPAPRHTPLSFAEINALLGENRAIVQFAIGDDGTQLFVLLPGPIEATLRVFTAPKATRELLQAALQTEWFEPYHRYREATQKGSPQLGRFRKAWRAAIEGIGPRLAEMLDFQLIHECLREAGIRKVILIPYQLLHLLPLQLMTGDLEVSFAPSLAILKACQLRTRRGRSQGLLIENPDGTLVFSPLEIRLIGQLMPQSLRLTGDECRWANVQSALPAAEIVHYSGHAYFDPREPLASALVLADRRLTLGEIMASSDLSASSLAVLSACETSQVSSLSRGDEYAGLPSGFLFAGAPNVIGTLWVVEDVAGPIAMQELYRRYLEGASVGVAFAAAIKRLRSVTAAELLSQLDPADPDPGVQRLLTICRLQPDKSMALFNHPEYWAAFTLVGHT